jgi:hypothetical protein
MKTIKILRTVLTLLAVSILGAGIFSSIGLNPNVGMAAFAITSVFFGLVNQSMPNFTFSTVVPPTTDIAAIAKWSGMYSKQLFAQMINNLDVFQDLTVDRNVSLFGKVLGKFKANGGLRPLDTAVTDNGQSQRSLGGRKLMVYDAMKVFNIIVDDLRPSFLSDMMVPGAKEIPMAQWFWQKEFEKLGSEINDNFAAAEYAGDAAAWASGTAYTFSSSVPTYRKFGANNDIYRLLSTTSAGESPTTHPAKWSKVNDKVTHTGPLTIIKNEITAGNHTNVITTGTITDSNGLDKIELMYRGMTVAHRNAGGVVWVSPIDFACIMAQYRSEYPNFVSNNDGDAPVYIYASGKKWQIKQATWLGSSRRIIFDVMKSNLIVGTNLSSIPGITNYVPTLHGYDAVSKFMLGSEIADLEVLYTNEQV